MTHQEARPVDLVEEGCLAAHGGDNPGLDIPHLRLCNTRSWVPGLCGTLGRPERHGAAKGKGVILNQGVVQGPPKEALAVARIRHL
jgi:hypothetical protein